MKKQKDKLEICVANVASALAAQEAGATRIELCDNLLEGGTTPSIGMIRQLRKMLDIDIHVLIRPRGGDFVYSPEEAEVMLSDIRQASQYGVDGVVIGALLPDGTIDKNLTSRMIEAAWPLKTTFHRAFDFCVDPIRATRVIIELGIDILLTSGQQNSVPEGLDLIANLQKQYGSQIEIMPGGGINASNIEKIKKATGCRSFHMSARKSFPNHHMKNAKLSINSRTVPMDDEFMMTDLLTVREVLKKLNT